MKMRYFALLLIWFSILVKTDAQSFPSTYHEGIYGRLHYGFFIPPGYNPSEKYPLLIYLHGWGNDYAVYLDWYNQDFQNQSSCFVFTPRTPTSWADWSGWWEELSEPMQAALHVLDSMQTVYSIDTNRLYVYGISMGGEGTFDLLDKLPGKFAAAMSVCGGGRASWAENISHTPFWMFHGGADNVNPPSLTEDVYNELVRIGAKNMRYKMYPGYGHEIWNVAASEPSWHDWMFAHSKDDTACAVPVDQLELTGNKVSDTKISLQWNDIRDPAVRSEKIWYYKIYNTEGLLGTVEFNKTEFSFNVTNEIDTFYISAVNYHFKESNISNKIYYKDGEVITSFNESKNLIPNTLELYDNYPNPFNPVTRINYSIPVTVPSSTEGFRLVTLNVYDLLGREISTLVNEPQSPGNYEVEFDGSNLTSGIYLYRIMWGSQSRANKMVILK